MFIDIQADEAAAAEDKASMSPAEEEDDIVYATPNTPPNAYIAETFDDIVKYGKTWIKSQTKKDGVDAEIAKYDGRCLESLHS